MVPPNNRVAAAIATALNRARTTRNRVAAKSHKAVNVRARIMDASPAFLRALNSSQVSLTDHVLHNNSRSARRAAISYRSARTIPHLFKKKRERGITTYCEIFLFRFVTVGEAVRAQGQWLCRFLHPTIPVPVYTCAHLHSIADPDSSHHRTSSLTYRTSRRHRLHSVLVGRLFV